VLKDNEIPSEAHRRIWWIKNDKKIKDYFETDFTQAIKGVLEYWKLSPRSLTTNGEVNTTSSL